MINIGRKAPLWAAALVSLWMAACGGGGGGNSNPPPTKTTPSMTVTPSSQSISTIQSLTVTIAVTGSSGTPTGSVTLSSGSFTSSSATLSSGSASITIPAGKLAAGTDSLSAAYTPDSAGSANYLSASGTASVAVTIATPGVTLTPGSSSITTTQSLTVSVSVSGGSGAPAATGTVVLSGGSYTSSAATLSNGSASITIPAGKLTVGSYTLTATYTPDIAGAAIYNSASGTTSSQVAVTLATPTVTVSPASQSITTAQTLPVTITVSGGSGAPAATGSVVLSGGGYNSGSKTLSNGSASLIIPANTLAAGNDTLTAVYAPDTSGSNVYTSAQGAASVTVGSGPMITSFTAGTNPLAAGNGTTLTAVFSGGTGVITAPGGYSQNVTSGTPVTVNPTITTTYTLTVGPTGNAVTKTLTLTVYPSVSVCTTSSCSGPAISNQLLGMNLAMWYDDVGNASSILGAFKTAGITAVRWPGGSDSDLYHWANNDGCNGLYVVGDDDFKDFETKIVQPGNLDLAVTADYGTDASCDGGPGQPSEAAAWAAQAVTDGTPIHYMTIGNEEYGNWEVDDHTGASQNNPTVYACEMTGCTNLPSGLSTGLPSGTPGFYSAIKTAVEGAGGTANTTLVGVEVNDNSSCCATNANNWDSTVLSLAKGAYDFVEFHYYPQNPPNESDAFVVQNSAKDFTNNIKNIQSELTTAGAPNTPIYVGEISTVSSNPGKQSWSITQGLFAGQILGEAMNDGVARLTWWIGFGNCNGNQGNNSSSLYGWQNFGAYNVFADGPGDLAYPNNSPCNYGGPIGTMSPTAEAFNLFQNVAIKGEFPQTTSVQGDTTNIRAYAATHSAGYALVLFNLNQTAAETVSVSIGGMSTSTGGVTVTTYDKEIYDQSDATCATDLGCSYNSGLTYPAWAGPTTSTMAGPLTLPLTLTLQPWSMNVVIVKP